MLRAAISLARSSLSLSPAILRVPAKLYSQLPNSGGFGGDSAANLPTLFVVQPRLRPESALQAKLQEAVCLADSLGDYREDTGDIQHHGVADKKLPQHVVVQNPSARGHRARADTYFGQGTVANIKIHLDNAESKGDEIDAVFVNAMLSGVQQRNLERRWGKPVLDRVGLIIEIFHAHASTREGKLQAELAALMYKKTRLVRVRGEDGRLTFGAEGESEVVSARGRGSGGRGFIAGAGETELGLQRRRIADRRKFLKAQIEEVRRTRALQRASRKRQGGLDCQGLPTVAIVGYTNAGKSTLVSALSDTPLFSDSRLFATVDPRLRNVVLPSGRKVLVSDTVGFISDLPVQLVEAFHATLEEVVEADLLVHVLDSTAPNLEEHRSTVISVLEQIGVSKEKIENMIEVWNKIDAQDTTVNDNTSSLSGEDEDDLVDDQDDLESIDEDDNVEDLESIDGDDQEDLEDDHSDGSLEIELTKEVVDSHKASSDELESFDGNFQEDDNPNDWLESENNHKHQVNDHNSSVLEQSTTMEQQKEQSDPLCIQNRSSPDVKTSALNRIGLTELLELIDQKLKTEHVVERTVFDKKWRPPREEENEETKVAI